MDSIFVQALGLAALAINLFSFSTVNDRRLRALLFGSCSLFAIHYVLLGAAVAGVNLVINAVRAFVSLRFTGVGWFVLFAALQTVMSAVLYATPLDIVPWVASLITGFALFCLSGIKLRIAMLLGTLTWMINSVLVGSWGGMLNDAINGTALLLTIWRLHRQPAVS